MATNSVEYSKKYYEKNKQTMLENARIKTKCLICGSIVTKCQLKRHMRSIKCNSYIEQLKTFKDMSH